MRHLCYTTLILLLISSSGCSTARPGRPPETTAMVLSSDHRDAEESAVHPDEPKGVWHTVVWYVPNRVLDLVDVFRFRLRAGPGLSANVRVTDYANVFIGRYHSAFLGLPGPRMGPEIRSPIGWEQERGILLMGVDATDDLAHEPGYSPTEFNLGFQALIIGGEVGFDPVELADFLLGFFLYDVRKDDR
jgi:hypothetical protein